MKQQNQDKKSGFYRYPCCKSGNTRVVVIGGGGQLGGRFVRCFQQSGYQVAILEADDWQHADSRLADAALVLIAVPIHLTEAVIRQLANLPHNCILADITSIKAQPLELMLEVHAGGVVGLHPMFGPDVAALNGQTIVLCHGRDQENYAWLWQQLEAWGLNIHCVSATEHDRTMAIVQVLRHFSTVVYGAHLARENVELDKILAMSSPIYRLELAMVGRLFAQDPDLYTEIIFANPQNIAMMRRYIEQYDKLLSLVEQQDKQGFKKVFRQTSDWFGDYAQAFLQESGHLLNAAHKKQH